MPPTALRVLVTLVAALAAVAQVAYLDALSWHALGLATPRTASMRPPFLTVMTAHAVVSVVAGVIAVALVLHEGTHDTAARGLGLAMGAWSYLTAYSGATLLLRPTQVACEHSSRATSWRRRSWASSDSGASPRSL